MVEESDVRIRKYRPDDRDAVIELVRELQIAEGKIYDRMKPPEAMGDWYLDDLLDSCEKQKGQIYVADQLGAVVGYAVVLAEVPSDEVSPDEISYLYAFITDVAVTESLRGQGIGKALLQKCETFARGHKAKWLRIGVLVNNRQAVRSYEKAGYVPLTMELEKPLT